MSSLSAILQYLLQNLVINYVLKIFLTLYRIGYQTMSQFFICRVQFTFRKELCTFSSVVSSVFMRPSKEFFFIYYIVALFLAFPLECFSWFPSLLPFYSYMLFIFSMISLNIYLNPCLMVTLKLFYLLVILKSEFVDSFIFEQEGRVLCCFCSSSQEPPVGL